MVVLARVEDARLRKVVWSQVVKGASEFFITADLQFNRALQNRAMEQAGRFVAADLAARFLLQLETVRSRSKWLSRLLCLTSIEGLDQWHRP